MARMVFLKSLAVLLSLVVTVNGFAPFGIDVFLPDNAARRLMTPPRPPSSNKASQATARPFDVTKYNNKASTLCMSSSDIQDDSPWYSQVSIPYAIALVVFIGFAAFLAPGEFGSETDNAMIQAYIDNPTSPGLNPIFNAEFNLLGAAPLVLAGLVCPQAVPNKGLPPAPFLAASAFAGYGGLGPYMIFRKGPRENVTRSDLGWFVKNVLESKVFSKLVIALCAYQYIIMAGPLLDSPGNVWSEFVDLVSTSKFASVSTLDLFILSLTGASLIPQDYKYRRPDAKESRANLIAASTLLLPLLGAALYCALRMPLPEE